MSKAARRIPRQLELLHLSIPLVVPFVNAEGPIVDRQIGLVRLSNGETIGWGETSPYPEQDASLDSVISATIDGEVVPAFAAGLDQAEYDLAARLAGQSLFEAADPLSISVAVGAGPGAIDTVGQAVASGVKRFKIKVAPDRVDHVREIRFHHPDVVLGIDGNGSFDTETVYQMAALTDLNLAYVEEPARGMGDDVLAMVRDRIDAPIFADESIRSTVDIESVAGSRFIDGVVLKPGRLGLTGALTAVDLADSVGLRWRASGLLETAIGRSYTNLLASMSNAFVSDVAPAGWFFERDVIETVVKDGKVMVPKGPGIGVEPDEGVIDRYLVARYDLSHLLDR